MGSRYDKCIMYSEYAIPNTPHLVVEWPVIRLIPSAMQIIVVCMCALCVQANQFMQVTENYVNSFTRAYEVYMCELMSAGGELVPEWVRRCPLKASRRRQA